MQISMRYGLLSLVLLKSYCRVEHKMLCRGVCVDVKVADTVELQV